MEKALPQSHSLSTASTFNNNHITINAHLVDVYGNELDGAPASLPGATGIEYDATPTAGYIPDTVTSNGKTYHWLSTHYDNYNGPVITRLIGINNGGGLIPSGTGSPSYTVEFYDGEDLVARQEFVGVNRIKDVYIVYVTDEDYVLEDTIAEDGCLHVQKAGNDITTGENGEYVKWYKQSTNGTWTEITQHKANGKYIIGPEAGGPQLNVALDEGAQVTYKAEVYRKKTDPVSGEYIIDPETGEEVAEKIGEATYKVIITMFRTEDLKSRILKEMM